MIGINTAIVASGQGIGFSIPINMAREVMDQLIARGRVVRGWLGIVIQDLTADLAAGFGLPERRRRAHLRRDEGRPRRGGGNARRATSSWSSRATPIKEVTDLQRRVAAVEPGARPPSP